MKGWKTLCILALLAGCGWLYVGAAAAVAASGNDIITRNALVEMLRPIKAKPQPGGTRGPGGIVIIDPDCPEAEKPQVALQLQFGLNSATLRPKAVAQLRELARALEDESLRKYKFSIEGHTCNLGSAKHNLELSRQRANAVYDWLTSFTSLSPQQFVVHGFGESCPAVPNTSEANRSLNRRVVIKNTLEIPKITHAKRPVTLQVIRYYLGQPEVLTDGDSLTSNTSYAVRFATADKPYAYICQIDAAGAAVPIFPNPKFSNLDNPLAPETMYRVPNREGQGIMLDHTVGEEQFVLLALDKPVDDPRTMCTYLARENSIGRIKLLQRGVKGIVTLTPAVSGQQPSPDGDGEIQLCDVVTGGRVILPGQAVKRGTTRGPAGIVSLDDNYHIPEQPAQTCQGYIMRRTFRHKL